MSPWALLALKLVVGTAGAHLFLDRGLLWQAVGALLGLLACELIRLTIILS